VAVAAQETSTAVIASGHLASAAFAANSDNSGGAQPLVGNNPKDASGRVNTDLPGGHEAGQKAFGELTQGQDVEIDPRTGHQIAEDGTRLRLNQDGTARVDVPASTTRPKHETVHFNQPDTPQN
jgi:hypothetical protein